MCSTTSSTTTTFVVTVVRDVIVIIAIVLVIVVKRFRACMKNQRTPYSVICFTVSACSFFSGD